MLTSVEGIYKDGKVNPLETPADSSQTIIAMITSNLARAGHASRARASKG